MANTKVSQMTSLTANQVAVDDVLLITDISEMTSKKISTSDLLIYIQSSGSFSGGITSVPTASYILGSNVNGTVVSSSYSDTSSYAHLAVRSLNSDTASYVTTASYVNITGAEVGTASYLKYNGVFNGTSSYSLTSSFVNLSKTSSFLLFIPGINNGTASRVIGTSSYAETSSYADVAKTILTTGTIHSDTASWASSSISSSYSTNGIVNWYNVQSYVQQVGTGGTAHQPKAVSGLEVKLKTTDYGSTFHINVSVRVSDGGLGGRTNVGLWRSSSLSVGPLITSFAAIHGSDDETTYGASTTFIDKPLYNPGTPVTYSVQIWQSDGNDFYVNRNKNNDDTSYCTSSITVMEFITPIP